MHILIIFASPLKLWKQILNFYKTKVHFFCLKEAVLLLLRYNADVNLKNSEGNTPRQTSKSQDIRDLIAGLNILKKYHRV